MVLLTIDEISFYESVLRMENLWTLNIHGTWLVLQYAFWAIAFEGFKNTHFFQCQKKILDSDVNMGTWRSLNSLHQEKL